MTVQCADCAHFRLRDAGRAAANGLGLCHPEKAPWHLHSMSYQRQCDKWVPAKDDVIAERKAWTKKGQKKCS